MHSWKYTVTSFVLPFHCHPDVSVNNLSVWIISPRDNFFSSFGMPFLFVFTVPHWPVSRVCKNSAKAGDVYQLSTDTTRPWRWYNSKKWATISPVTPNPNFLESVPIYILKFRMNPVSQFQQVDAKSITLQRYILFESKPPFPK